MQRHPRGGEAVGSGAKRFPVSIALALYGALALAACVWRGLADRELPLTAPGGLLGGPAQWLAQAALGGAAALLLILASRLWTRHTRVGRSLAQALARALGPLPGPSLLALALASGLAEEAFFRGALQPRVGWLPASFLFGLAHLVPRRELVPWAAFAVLAGLLFGALFEHTGSLVAPAVAHVLVNAVNLRWLADSVRPPPDL